MAITQIDLEAAENLLKELLGNSDSAEAYSKDPEGWLKSNGYDNVSPEAVQQCAVSYAGSGGAYASTAAGAATSGVAGVAAALDPVVYNHYYTVDNSIDNSITNNIANNGTLDFDQTIGDGNVDIEGSNVVDSQIQTGSGIQSGEDTNISNSNVATGDDNQQAIDQSSNIEDSFNTDVDQSINDSFNTDVDTNVDQSTNIDDSFNTDLDPDT